MNITLITTSFQDGLEMENVGVGRLTAYLSEKGHKVTAKYIDSNQTPDAVLDELDPECPVYGFSAYNNNMEFFLELSKLIKQRNQHVIIVFGSKFINLYYDDFINRGVADDIDFFILGDGEYTLQALLDCMERGDDVFLLAKNNEHLASKEYYINKSPLSIDINELPLPNRDWIRKNNNVSAYICDCHGCIGRCSFCTYGKYHDHWSGRSAESLFLEVKDLYTTSNVRLFSFNGGSFEDPGRLGKEKIQKFCEQVIESGIKVSLRCYLRADTFSDNPQDVDLLRLMNQAGFNIVSVGIESGNDTDLRIYNKRAMLKDNYEIMKVLEKSGIYGGFYGFIMFNPYSTLNGLKQNYEFLNRFSPHNCYKFLGTLELFRNTPIYNKAQEDGLVLPFDTYDWKQIIKYKFANDDVSELYQFMQGNLYKDNMFYIMMEIYHLSAFIRSFVGFTQDSGIISKLEEYSSEFGKRTSEYFYHLFVENDLGYCDRQYPDYANEVQKHVRKISILKSRLVKDMMRNKYFKF